MILRTFHFFMKYLFLIVGMFILLVTLLGYLGILQPTASNPKYIWIGAFFVFADVLWNGLPFHKNERTDCSR